MPIRLDPNEAHALELEAIARRRAAEHPFSETRSVRSVQLEDIDRNRVGRPYPLDAGKSFVLLRSERRNERPIRSGGKVSGELDVKEVLEPDLHPLVLH
jgi:hypothetical protein